MEAVIGDRRWSIWSGEELLQSRAAPVGPCVAALGTFDGVHLGHQRILEEAAALAAARSLTPVVVTFDRHPAAVLAPEKAPPLLTSFDERIRRILATGIEHVVVIRFDRAFSEWEAETFLEEGLVRSLEVKGVVVGYNFRFGRGARGDGALLSRAGDALGLDVRTVPPVERDGAPVSSTRIRRSLEEGDVESARRLLGREYSLEGRVVRGDARGRTLGYPTANLAAPPELLTPKEGVYLTRILPDANDAVAGRGRERIFGLTAISSRPTFDDGGARSIESFLLDFSGDLYGRAMRIEFLERLRGIVRFESAEALKTQIEQDVAEARKRLVCHR